MIQPTSGYSYALPPERTQGSKINGVRTARTIAETTLDASQRPPAPIIGPDEIRITTAIVGKNTAIRRSPVEVSDRVHNALLFDIFIN